MELLQKLAESSALAALLGLTLYIIFYLHHRAESERWLKLFAQITRLEFRLQTLLEILVLHDMTVTGVNPTTDIRSDDAEIVKIAVERGKRTLDLIKELRDDINRASSSK